MTSTIQTERVFSLCSSLPAAATPGDGEAASGNRRQLLLQLRLTAQFHASLELPAILAIFASEAASQLGIRNLAYSHPLQNISYQSGEETLHHCSYQLERNGKSLGALWMGRRQRFSPRDLEKLETLLACMVPALSNGLDHRAATEAAVKDELTGCGNRTALELWAGREVACARRHGHPTAMLVIDCDHFKSINDGYGHRAGDAVLHALGRTLRSCSRDCDGVFRYGGEEFVMLLGQTTLEAAAAVAERVRGEIAALAIAFDGASLAVTATIGVAALYLNETFESWFQRADQALYRGKTAGRNRVALAPIGQPA